MRMSDDEVRYYIDNFTGDVYGLAMDLKEAREEAMRLRALLLELEWSDEECPSCYAVPENGHNLECRLAAELGRTAYLEKQAGENPENLPPGA